MSVCVLGLESDFLCIQESLRGLQCELTFLVPVNIFLFMRLNQDLSSGFQDSLLEKKKKSKKKAVVGYFLCTCYSIYLIKVFLLKVLNCKLFRCDSVFVLCIFSVCLNEILFPRLPDNKVVQTVSNKLKAKVAIVYPYTVTG